MSRRNLLVGVGAVALLVVLAAAAGGYAYFFSGLRTAPKPLALATPTPGASVAATPTPAGDLTGNWKVAGRDVSERDHLVSQSLAVNRFPNATFQSSQIVALPTGFSDGQQVQLPVPGQLTIRGVTQDVTVNVTRLRLAGSQVQAAGMIQTTMGAFGVPPPRAPFVTLDQNVTIGFALNFARA